MYVIVVLFLSSTIIWRLFSQLNIESCSIDLSSGMLMSLFHIQHLQNAMFKSKYINNKRHNALENRLYLI